jgi:hypothetical protein
VHVNALLRPGGGSLRVASEGAELMTTCQKLLCGCSADSTGNPCDEKHDGDRLSGKNPYVLLSYDGARRGDSEV